MALRKVFDCPTIAGLATVIVEAQLDAMPEEELEDLLEGLDVRAPLSSESVAPTIGDAV